MGFQVLISDAIVCWRVCVVFGKDKRVIGTATILLMALACMCVPQISMLATLTIVVAAGLILCNLTQIGVGFPAISRHLRALAPDELPIDIVTLILSALVNIWATGMIGYRAW